MHVNGVSFLVNVLTPIRMTFATKIQSRSVENIYKALHSQLGDIKGKGFKISKLKCDPDSGFRALGAILGDEHGITVEPVGNNEHIPVVERKIRTIKERVRGIVNTLPYKLPLKLLALLVLFCVSRINMCPTTALSSSITPWERYNGKKVDYKRNLRASFGEYCQAHTNQADNTLDSRTTGRITV